MTVFLYYLSMLSGSALIHLGKLINPATGKIERNLEAAQATIDILTMLSDKTRGNLTPEEESSLKNTLSTLQLNYVDEAGKPEPETAPEEKPPGEKAASVGEKAAPEKEGMPARPAEEPANKGNKKKTGRKKDG